MLENVDRQVVSSPVVLYQQNKTEGRCILEIFKQTSIWQSYNLSLTWRVIDDTLRLGVKYLFFDVRRTSKRHVYLFVSYEW